MTIPVDQVQSDHVILPITPNSMELRDARDSGASVIATATRESEAAAWTIKASRDPSLTWTASTRAEAITALWFHGPAGIDTTPPTAGYSTVCKVDGNLP